jgi:hypothetical protein
VSGRRGAGERKRFAALFEDASRRKLDCVPFWARSTGSVAKGMVATIQHPERLSSYGVTFHSYTEPHLCADNEMVRGILLAVLATMAKQDRRALRCRCCSCSRCAGLRSGFVSNPLDVGDWQYCASTAQQPEQNLNSLGWFCAGD